MKNNYLRRYITYLRSVGLHWIVLNPLVCLFANPYALIKSLYSLRILKGEWRYYNGHSSTTAFLNLFYWVQTLNLHRHGRNGTSPTLGCGAFDMRHFWFQSLLAITMTSALGRIIVSLIGMSAWLAGHLVWLDQGQPVLGFAAVTLLCALFSNNFYGNLFGSQNYNVLAWAFFPVGLWGMMEHHFWITAIAWLAVPFLSITVYALASTTTILFCALYRDPALALTLLPGLLYFCNALQLFEVKAYREMKGYVVELLASLGTRRDSRYQRPMRIIYALGISAFLASFPLSIFALNIHSAHQSCRELVLLSAMPVAFFFINESRLFRIADPQTSLMFFFTVTTAVTIASSSYLLLALYWLTNSNAIISMLHYHFDCTMQNKVRYTPVVRPFDIAPFLRRLDRFLEKVLPGKRILVAFSNPGSNYTAIFDGFSTLYDPLFFCANKKGVHAMPDWYTVSELNHEDSPEIWGRTPAEVRKNMDTWQADFALIYDLENNFDAAVWKEYGFRTVSEFSWAEFRNELANSPLIATGWPTWRLIQRM